MSPRGGRWWWRRAFRMTLLLSAAGLLLTRPSFTSQLEADFPHHHPDRLAHFLADFTNYPNVYTHISGPWQVVEEQSNLTWWRYTVSYECGTRCEGRLQLDHTQTPLDPSAGREHRVLVRDERCSRVPLLPWPRICEDTHTETSVSPRAGGGAKLAELSVSRCGLLGALTKACGALDRDEVLRNWKRTLAEVSLQQ
ncbi:hypothetical protein KGM_209391 [Danaus plexippus plexippus]|uniref:Uncharacterized protein n=1 Tax=Danaus plexippus plexippus TaxID=278856 RepID=A0A212ET55_DANPL|nr:hypothetical protein KGM_209391 [Danaus plexippus plexippus]